MSSLSTISVIIPSYGRTNALCDNISDLLVQKHAPTEIIVIHQCPKPELESTQKLRDWAKEGRIRLYEPSEANAQKARNFGILEARGEVLLFLDDDIRAPPQLVERHLLNYVEDPSLDGVVGQILRSGELPTGVFEPRYFWPHIGWQNFPLNYAKRSPVKNWPSTNSSIRRSVALEIGGFDEQYGRTWLDDTDFSCRLLARNAKLIFDPTATVTHLRVPSGGKRLKSRSDLWMDRMGWMTHFYFWMKNLGLWKARYPLLWNVRYLIFRKAVLVRPHWFLRNVWYLARGYRDAARILREGPKYLRVQLPSK